jgi:MSHA pilin protein MshD
MSTNQSGLSLIELLVFIVVVGIAVTGVLSVYSLNARSSADPMVRKQALAIAESLLEEVLSKPYTYCDPDDANADTAANVGACAIPEGMGPEVAQGETRYSNVTPFDNVNDYNGFNMPAPPGIDDLSGSHVTGLDGYSASVQVQQPAGAFNGVPASETLLVTVTVTAPGNLGVSLSGYRTRYAPTL